MYSKKLNSTNTNITVEKIDTTETYTRNTHTKKTKKTQKESKSSYENTDKKENDKKEKEKEIQNHLESLDELSLVLTNVSENYDPSVIDTETLINRSENTKKYHKKTNRITLQFTKNTDTNHLKYTIINKILGGYEFGDLRIGGFGNLGICHLCDTDMPKFRTIFLTNSEKSSLEMHFVRGGRRAQRSHFPLQLLGALVLASFSCFCNTLSGKAGHPR